MKKHDITYWILYQIIFWLGFSDVIFTIPLYLTGVCFLIYHFWCNFQILTFLSWNSGLNWIDFEFMNRSILRRIFSSWMQIILTISTAIFNLFKGRKVIGPSNLYLISFYCSNEESTDVKFKDFERPFMHALIAWICRAGINKRSKAADWLFTQFYMNYLWFLLSKRNFARNLKL